MTGAAGVEKPLPAGGRTLSFSPASAPVKESDPRHSPACCLSLRLLGWGGIAVCVSPKGELGKKAESEWIRRSSPPVM